MSQKIIYMIFFKCNINHFYKLYFVLQMNNLHRKKRCANIINEQKTLLIKCEIVFFFLDFHIF